VSDCLVDRQKDSMFPLTDAKVMSGGYDPAGDGLSETSILPRILPMSKSARKRAVPAQVAGRICRYLMQHQEAVEQSDNPTMDRP
jgi:hypothetical protein